MANRRVASPGVAESGQVLVAVALLSVVLVGFLGVALDGGMMFLNRRRMQTAADAGAYAGALEIWHKRLANVTGAARNDSALNGYTHAAGTVQVAVHVPPISGPWAGKTTFVEVVITETYKPFFMQVMGFGTSPVRARAVAGLSISEMGCIWALHPTAEKALEVSSGSTIAADCGVQVNSNNSKALHVSSGSSLTASQINVHGGTEISGSVVNPAPTTGAPVLADPLAGMPKPPVSGCTYGTNGGTVTKYESGGTVTIGDPVSGYNVFCGGLFIGSGTTVHMNPGVYIMRGGGFQVTSNSTVTGNGIGVFNTTYNGGDFKEIFIQSGSTAQLKASPNAPMAGILFWQDVGPGIPCCVLNKIESNTSSYFEGVLYFPTQTLMFHSNTVATGGAAWTMVIASIVQVTSNTTLGIGQNYGSGLSVPPLMRPSLVE